MANKKHLLILKQGVEAWNSWRWQHPNVRLDLADADLTGANLKRAYLVSANLTGANLDLAFLCRANLTLADLCEANVSGSDLAEVDLAGAHLYLADLHHADLTEADLLGANLTAADLTGVNLNFCTVGGTVFADLDLSHITGLDTVRHEYPSSMGVDTICRSAGNIPDVFLRGAGVPERFIEYTHSSVEQTMQFHSCLIRYSPHDQSFSERILIDLQAHAVRVWYFPKDTLMDPKVRGQIDRNICIYDRLVVVCSEHSLQSVPVLLEIGRALQREDNEGTQVLFPVRLDDYIFEHWQHERKADVIAKVVGDFSGWDKDAAKYKASFRKLMKALQPETDGGEATGSGAGKKALLAAAFRM